MKTFIIKSLIVTALSLLTFVPVINSEQRCNASDDIKAIIIYREGEEAEITKEEVIFLMNKKIPEIIEKISKVIRETTI